MREDDAAERPAMIPASVLDLSMVSEGGTVADALSNTLDLARHVEQLGYHRFWLAEHHNMVGIASAALRQRFISICLSTASSPPTSGSPGSR